MLMPHYLFWHYLTFEQPNLVHHPPSLILAFITPTLIYCSSILYDSSAKFLNIVQHTQDSASKWSHHPCPSEPPLVTCHPSISISRFCPNKTFHHLPTSQTCFSPSDWLRAHFSGWVYTFYMPAFKTLTNADPCYYHYPCTMKQLTLECANSL